MEALIKELKIETENGQKISATKFSSRTSSQHTIVISSATGVLQKFYSKFAVFCADHRITVYTFDYSGIGKSISSITDLKNYSGNLTSWGKQDQAAVIAFAKNENPDSALTLITHSIGGQIVGFNPNYELIDNILMVGSQGGFWNNFSGIHKLKMWLFWYAILPISTYIFGYFPAKKLGLFENLPKKMANEWAKWGRKKEYMMHFKNEDYIFDKIKVPILSWSFPNDSFAPPNAVDWLMKQYKNAEITRKHYTQEAKNQPGHFGFFKIAFKDVLWEENLNWILNNVKK